MEMEADTGGMWPQAQGRLEPPEAGRGRKEPPLVPVEGAQPCPVRTSHVWPPELEKMIPVSEATWYLVRAASHHSK